MEGQAGGHRRGGSVLEKDRSRRQTYAPGSKKQVVPHHLASNKTRAELEKRERVRYAKEMKERKRLSTVFSKFDIDQSGHLSKEQLQNLLTHIDGSTPAGTTPSDEEVAYVTKVLFGSGRFSTMTHDVKVLKADLAFAISTFEGYAARRKALEELVKKHDSSETGALNNEELKAVLNELVGEAMDGDGDSRLRPVDDEDVEHIRAAADANGTGEINAAELFFALHFWAHCCGCSAAELHETVPESKKGGCACIIA